MVKPILLCTSLLLLAKGFFAIRFQIDLVKRLSLKSLSDNFAVSPFGVYQALSLFYLGKDTRRDVQLARALRLTGRRHEKITSYFDKSRQKAVTQEFTLANRVYVSPKYNVSEKMKKHGTDFGVDIENIGFSDVEKSKEEIKKWFSKSINKAGNNLFEKEDLTNITEIVAVQGISATTHWKYRFKSMSNMLFSVARPNKKPVSYKAEMMYTVAPLQFFSDDEVRGAMIPFSNTDIGMLVILPRQKFGTKRILQNLDKYLQIPLKKAEDTHLFLPILSFQDTVDLNSVLQELGIQKLFTSADPDRNATVANFKQFNGLQIKPNRVLIYTESGADDDQRVLKLNKPFAYVIKDESTIYMAGRVSLIP
ncbi:accessory gland protein Acp76A [Drosophila ficusphila]|uniref:accessory gland protein Acp76A n=1 Tax=Drosophila ficusphila TaxID=30025 RepID=UPI0007E61C50|nr:accessory gland protein Acp76A [Drosophila ficusphila]